MMVELRWVTRTSLAKTVNDFDITFQVLRYRQYSLDTSRSPVASWSEWIDVPTVTENG